MSPFTPKDWKDANTFAGGGDQSTPLSAAALEDLETRLSDYSDSQGSGKVDKATPNTITADHIFTPTGGVGSVTAKDLAVDRQASFNPKYTAYGAGGAGAGDDAPEIQAAINAAAATISGDSLGATVELSPGEYLLNSQITIPYNVTVRGAGSGVHGSLNGATTLRCALNGQAILVEEGRYGWGLRNLTIVGDTSLGSQDLLTIGEGNNALPTDGGVLEDVYIRDAGRDNLVVDDALNLDLSTVYCHKAERYNLRVEGQSNSIKFTKCRFREAKQWGVYWKGGSGTFDTCTIESNSRHATVSYGGILVDPNDADAAAHVVLSLLGCHFENNAGVDGEGEPFSVLTGTRSAIITDVGSVYEETDDTRTCTITDCIYTAVGLRSNLTTHATLSGTTDLWIGCEKHGAGEFTVSGGTTPGFLPFVNDTWQVDVAGNQKRYDAAGGTTIHKALDHVFRNASDVEIIKFGGGPSIGFFGATPATQAAAYTTSNVTTDRTFNANATTLDEIADVLGTLIADLRTYGLLS